MINIKKIYRNTLLLEMALLLTVLVAVGQIFILWFANYDLYASSKLSAQNNIFEDYLLRYGLILICLGILMICTYVRDKAALNALGIFALLIILIQNYVLISFKSNITKYDVWNYGFLLKVSYYIDFVLFLVVILTLFSYFLLKLSERKTLYFPNLDVSS
jgi:hypothetical protein